MQRDASFGSRIGRMEGYASFSPGMRRVEGVYHLVLGWDDLKSITPLYSPHPRSN